MSAITQEELAEQMYQLWHIAAKKPFVQWPEFRADKANSLESNAWALIAKQAITLLHEE